jgi:hypothetical protein
MLAAGFILSFTFLFQPLLLGGNEQEPTYQGKTMSYWLEEYDQTRHNLSSDWFVPFTEEQTNAVLYMGTNAIPWLIKGFSSGHLSSRGYVDAFRVLGPLARSAIPDLVHSVTNQPETIYSAGELWTLGSFDMLALGGIGKDAVPALVQILTNSISTGHKDSALEAIASVGTNALSALPVVVRYVSDTNEMVAVQAVWTVGAVGARQPAGVQALERIMQIGAVPGRRIRGAALTAFRGFGEECAAAVIPALDDTDAGDHYMAFWVLRASAPDALTNAAVLRRAATGLRSSDPERQDLAVNLLRAASQQAHGENPVNMTWAPFHEEEDYREATNALSRLSPELYNEYIAAQVQFHTHNSNNAAKQTPAIYKP